MTNQISFPDLPNIKKEEEEEVQETTSELTNSEQPLEPKSSEKAAEPEGSGKEEQPKKRKDNDPSVGPMRMIAHWVAVVLSKTPITPNQVTFFSFIIFAPFIVYFLSTGEYFNGLIALVLIFITVIFDLSDGMLARMKQVSSSYGAYLDASLDKIFQFLILIAVVVGSVFASNDYIWFVWGLALLAGQAMADFIGFQYARDFKFDVYTGSQEFLEKFKAVGKISWLDAYLKNIIVPCKFLYIFFFTARYLLVLGIILNQLYLFVIIFAITINLRWLSMYLLYIKYLSKTPSKLKTVRFLQEIKE